LCRFARRAKSGVIKTEYKHDSLTLLADVDCNLGGPLVNASATVGHQVGSKIRD
jgi:hypothetical protein